MTARPFVSVTIRTVLVALLIASGCDSQQCQERADSGMCEQNPDFMKKNCWLTCQFEITDYGDYGEDVAAQDNLPPAASGLEITMSVDNITEDVTEFLDIKCTFDINAEEAVDVESLKALYLQQYNDGKYRNLVSITSTTGLFQGVDVGGKADGVYDDEKEDYFVSMTWEFPRSSLARHYRCSADVEVIRGDSSVKVGLNLPEVDLTTDELLQILRGLRSEEAILQETIDTTKDQLAAYQKEKRDYSGKSTALKTTVSDLEKEIEKVKDDPNYKSDFLEFVPDGKNKNLVDLQGFVNNTEKRQAWKVHITDVQLSGRNLYWMEGLERPLTVDEATTLCAYTGGKLVEVPFDTLNDKKNALQNANLEGDFWVGLSRTSESDSWVYTSTGDNVAEDDLVWRSPVFSQDCYATYRVGSDGYYSELCDTEAGYKALCMW